MDQTTEMLPEEQQELVRLQREQQIQRLEAFGLTLAKKRDDAVSGRTSSGIEQEWLESEEQYQGTDDANRQESSGALKPATVGGSFIGKAAATETRSTVFMNITRPYVDAAAAKVADMLLPTDDRNWGIKPTPIPALTQALEDETPVQMPQGMAMPPNPGPPPGVPPQGMPSGPQAGGQMMMPPQGMLQPPQPMRVKDLVQLELKKATDSAEKAEKQIEDWMVEAQYHAEVRKVIEDCSKFGTGILKGPFPEKRKRKAVINGAMVIEVTIAPKSKRINPWNLYPDPNCGESIQNGQYVFERDEITARQVKELAGTPGYLKDQIEAVIEEGPGKRFEASARKQLRNSIKDSDLFEIWYYHGIVDKDDLEVLGVKEENLPDGGTYAIITMINDRPIKAALQPLDDGEFPYDLMPWQRKPDQPWGTGVARQIRTPQRMVNAATRAMMDNAGVSAGGQFIIRRGAVEPADGSWAIVPRKLWFMRDDSDAKSVNDVFSSVQLASMQADLMAIIQYAQKMAEDVTGLPMILQGQQGKAPETLGGMQLLQNNASSVLRRLARTFDDCITEPHVRRYYTWLLEYGEDDAAKGDFQIDARGSTALVERDINNQAILGMGAMVINPAFGVDPKKWIKEALLAQRLSPEKFLYSEEEMAKMAQQQPPPPPQVMAAQIRAETDIKKTEMQIQADMQMDKNDVDRDMIYVQQESERTKIEYEGRMRELDMKLQLAQLDYAAKHQMQLEDVKAQLVQTAMSLRTQKEIATQKAQAEPAGRAPNGQAFAR